MPTGTYKISPNRYVCVGNFAFDGIDGGNSNGGSGSSSDNSSSSEIATAGIHFNLEFNLLYDDNDSNGKTNRRYSYNAALDQVKQLQTIIDYWNDDQFYNLLHNNCAEIATKTWNKVSDYELDGFDIMYSPRKLKKSIEKNKNSYSIDWFADNAIFRSADTHESLHTSL